VVSKLPLETVKFSACSRSISACMSPVDITGFENVRKSGLLQPRTIIYNADATTSSGKKRSLQRVSLGKIFLCIYVLRISP
jgi:hypothetical protein